MEHTFHVGQSVRWHYVSDSGWGWDYWVSPCTVIKVTAKRVQIEAPTRKGRMKKAYVKPENLEAM